MKKEEDILHDWFVGDDSSVNTFSSSHTQSYKPTTYHSIAPTTPTTTVTHHTNSAYHANVQELSTNKHPKQQHKLDHTVIAVDLAHKCCASLQCQQNDFSFPTVVGFHEHFWVSAKENTVLEKLRDHLRGCVTNTASQSTWTITNKIFHLQALGYPVCPVRLYENVVV
jgi:hypothetical protein